MCDQCEALMINGLYCHEIGCPDAWKDQIRECKWCGQEFEPGYKEDQFCDISCHESYHT